MNETKPWWQSRGVWGGVIAALVPVAAGAFGWDDETQKLVLDNTEVIVTGVATVVAAGVAVYGRLKAKKEIE